MGIHKGGLTSIYRPILLTSVPLTRFEHILSSHVTNHQLANSFFFDHQHGFRKGLSRDTRLAEFTHELHLARVQKHHADAIFLGFSKVFDRVPHRRLLVEFSSLCVYPLVIAYGRVSSSHLVRNSLHVTIHPYQHRIYPGGLCKGLAFLHFFSLCKRQFLLSNSKPSLFFAGDWVSYRTIKNGSGQIQFQNDPNKSITWCDTGLVPLNISKCSLVSSFRKR